MNYTRSVDRAERGCGTGRQRVKMRSAQGAVARHVPVKSRAGDEGRCQPRKDSFSVRIVHRYQARASHSLRELHFPPEPGAELVVRSLGGMDDLDGHLLARGGQCGEHRAHATRAEATDDTVGSRSAWIARLQQLDTVGHAHPLMINGTHGPNR